MTDHKRGELEIRQFSAAIMERLNDPRNIEKGDWKHMQRGELLSALIHEVGELTEEVSDTIPDYERVRAEAADVGALAMMLADQAQHYWKSDKAKAEDE